MSKGTCSVEGCDRDMRLAGLCGAHHQRKLRHGDVRAHIPLRGTDTDPSAYWCSKCHTHKPKDAFYTDKRARRGVHGVCSECIKARRRDRSDVIRRNARRYRERNADKLRKRKRDYYERNRDADLEASRRWRENNPERVRMQIAAQNAARRTLLRDAAGSASTEAVQARWDYYGGRCWMCGDTATDTDHVKPLHRGGCNWPANLRPACRSCNRAKGAKWPLDDFMERRAGQPSGR